MVERRLKQIMEVSGPDINMVGSYLFNNAGKRIRPALFLLAAYRPNQSMLPLIDAAVAFELLHTASLLHDDVIDQASTRRGKDAVHIKWGNKISVLTGDYLLSQAFKMIVSYHDWQLMDVVVDIVENITEGEVEQAFASHDAYELEEKYFQWIGKKSASFFAGCCRAGCLMAGGDSEQQMLWSNYGYNLGITFQLIDDLLDYTGDGCRTGKPLYGDLANRVITLPLIRSFDLIPGNGLLKKYLQNNHNTEVNLDEVARIIVSGDGPSYTYQKAEEYAKLSVSLIGALVVFEKEQRDLAEGLPMSLLQRSK
jgi:geranylgeranyl pyrophosphate synthase